MSKSRRNLIMLLGCTVLLIFGYSQLFKELEKVNAKEEEKYPDETKEEELKRILKLNKIEFIHYGSVQKFDLETYRVTDGKTVWEATYYFGDLENIVEIGGLNIKNKRR